MSKGGLEARVAPGEGSSEEGERESKRVHLNVCTHNVSARGHLPTTRAHTRIGGVA